MSTYFIGLLHIYMILGRLFLVSVRLEPVGSNGLTIFFGRRNAHEYLDLKSILDSVKI